MLLLWKSLVQATLDYCCQLWSPNTPGQIQMLEMVARNFIRQIKGLRHLSYWQQLAHLHMYSQQRRRERYMIIYIWKILEGHVPNFGISINYHIRRGRLCVIPTVKQSAPASIKTIRYVGLGLAPDIATRTRHSKTRKLGVFLTTHPRVNDLDRTENSPVR